MGETDDDFIQNLPFFYKERYLSNSGKYRIEVFPLKNLSEKENLSKFVEGVQEIINEIEIGNRSTIKDYASDLWINTQARAVAAKTVGLKAITFNFETIQGKIYVAGITARPDLLDEMIVALKNIKGVSEIVNYVIIREK